MPAVDGNPRGIDVDDVFGKTWEQYANERLEDVYYLGGRCVTVLNGAANYTIDACIVVYNHRVVQNVGTLTLELGIIIGKKLIENNLKANFGTNEEADKKAQKELVESVVNLIYKTSLFCLDPYRNDLAPAFYLQPGFLNKAEEAQGAQGVQNDQKIQQRLDLLVLPLNEGFKHQVQQKSVVLANALRNDKKLSLEKVLELSGIRWTPEIFSCERLEGEELSNRESAQLFQEAFASLEANRHSLASGFGVVRDYSYIKDTLEKLQSLHFHRDYITKEITDIRARGGSNREIDTVVYNFSRFITHNEKQDSLLLAKKSALTALDVFSKFKEDEKELRFFQKAFDKTNICLEARTRTLQSALIDGDVVMDFDVKEHVKTQILSEYFRVLKNKALRIIANERNIDFRTANWSKEKVRIEREPMFNQRFPKAYFLAEFKKMEGTVDDPCKIKAKDGQITQADVDLFLDLFL
jgi:hypothetical protein